MKKITVKLRDNPYEIIIGSKLLENIGFFVNHLNMPKYAYIITNSLIKKYYGNILKNSLNNKKIKCRFKLVGNTEKTKSIYVCIKIIKDILNNYRFKDLFIITFGGGVIGDLGGFIASIYKRGIPYIQIPTTFLGQIDSGIGGKTAVNLKEVKNIIGTFYQPSLVLNDTILLKTLDKRQMRSGIAEAIKYGLIEDSSILDYIENHLKEIFIKDKEILEELIYRCAKIKARIVELDEKEKKSYRTILNFGHTVGHALEAASDFKIYTHGEAVAIGMLIALELGMNLGLTPEYILQRVESLIKNVGLPTKINKKISFSRIIQAYYYDKKFRNQKNRFVILQDIGKAIIKENIPLPLIKKVIKKYY